jgi:alpha-mannosidase
MATRMRLADARHVRNEFFEADIDPATGGLRGLWDHRTRMNRLGQQLVFNPGSTMQATEVKVTSTGPALGEVVSEGAILGEDKQVLAKFRQRFRAWLGRPMLELRIEIYPDHAPEGYPWHSYYGARLAWRDERAMLLRSVTGTSYITSHTRPQTPDYLELRQGRQNTVIFPGGLPFHQRHGSRMLDIILLVAGETGQSFELGLSLDRDHPMQTAQGMVTPVPCLAVAKGPPHIGASGWLFHLDSPNLLLTSLRPGPGGADAVTARLLECGQHGGTAEFRCARNPRRAVLQDARAENQRDFDTEADTVHLEVPANDWAQVRVEFS